MRIEKIIIEKEVSIRYVENGLKAFSELYSKVDEIALLDK